MTEQSTLLRLDTDHLWTWCLRMSMDACRRTAAATDGISADVDELRSQNGHI